MAKGTGSAAPWIVVSCVVLSVSAATETHYMEDYCSVGISLTVPVLGEASSRAVQGHRGTVPDKEVCASKLRLGTDGGAQLGIVFEALNTFKHQEENFCIDFVDINPLESYLTRFCGHLSELVETSDVSEGNSLDILWNRVTPGLEGIGFRLAITAFVFADNGVCPAEGMYQCDNNRCIDERWVCDRVNNCGDNSDEVGCPGYKSSTTRQRISLLLVIAIATLAARGSLLSC